METVDTPGRAESFDEDPSKHPKLPELDLPQLPPSGSLHIWNDTNEKQLRSALIGACKRMPRNAEAHFHLGLMYMRKSDGDEALRSFQHCLQIYSERMDQYAAAGTELPKHLNVAMARLRSHAAQAAHMAAAASLPRHERTPLLERLQKDLVSSTSMDNTRPDVWNALALLHLTERGHAGARDVLSTIYRKFPEYLDALSNLALAELSLGNEDTAVSFLQRVILLDRQHPEALSNYAMILLRHGMYDAAIQAFEMAVDGTIGQGRGLAFAWGGLAVARAAIGQLDVAQEAAREAERTADPLNRPRFAMLMTSVQARAVTEELRHGLNSGMGASQARVDAKEEAIVDGQLDDGATSPEKNVGGDVTRELRPSIDGAVLRLRALARDIKSSAASTALGAVLRLRHDFAWEESGNRNFGAEAAERLVEALEKDQSDTPAWVQLALLLMSTGEYGSARDFAVQAISRSKHLESGWNTLGVACQLTDDVKQAREAYERGIKEVRLTYNKLYNDTSDKGNEEGEGHGTRSSRSGDGSRRGPAKYLFPRLVLQSTDEERDMEVERVREMVVCEKNDVDESDTANAESDADLQDDDEDDEEDEENEERKVEADDEGMMAIEDEDDEPVNVGGQRALAALYNNLGNLRRQQGGQFTRAMRCYERSLKYGGESAVVYNNLGLLYISVEKWSEAEAMLDHAVKLDEKFECAVSNRLKLRSLIRRRQRGNMRSGGGLEEGFARDEERNSESMGYEEAEGPAEGDEDDETGDDDVENDVEEEDDDDDDNDDDVDDDVDDEGGGGVEHVGL